MDSAVSGLSAQLSFGFAEPEAAAVSTQLVSADGSQDAAELFPDHAIEHLLDPAAQMARAVLEHPVIPPETRATPDRPLAVIDQIVAAIKDGRDLSPLRDEVQRLISNQEDRAQLISSLLLTHDYGRVSKYAKAREILENVILDAVTQRQLTPTQSLAFLKLITEESEVISARVRAGGTNIRDIVSLMNKADYASQGVTDAELRKKFTGTTPQGREIIRRLVRRLHKAAASDHDTIHDE